METHPSLPDQEDLDGMLEEEYRIVQEDISQAPSEYHTEEYVQKEIIEILFVYFAILSYEKITKNKPKSVHESIPRGSNMDAKK